MGAAVARAAAWSLVPALLAHAAAAPPRPGGGASSGSRDCSKSQPCQTAVRLLNAERAHRCKGALPLDEFTFLVKHSERDSAGDTLSLELQSLHGDDLSLVLGARGSPAGTAGPQDAQWMQLLMATPKPCDLPSGAMDDATRQTANGDLAKASQQFAEAQVNKVRQEQCPQAGSVVLSVADIWTRVIGGVEVALEVSVYMPAGIDVPGDGQQAAAEHRIRVTWSARQPAGPSDASASATVVVDKAPVGLNPMLFLPVPACELLLRSSSAKAPGPGDSGDRPSGQGGAAPATQRRLAAQGRSPRRPQLLPDLFEAHDAVPLPQPGRRLQGSFTESFDARLQTPQCYDGFEVPNQGHCGSSWAVAAAGAASDRVCQAAPNATVWMQSPGGPRMRRSFSAQRILSCGDEGFGCEGGSVYAAFRFMKGPAGGILEDFDPYRVRCWNGGLDNIVDLPMQTEFACEHLSYASSVESWPCECAAGVRQMPVCEVQSRPLARVLAYYRLPSVLDVDSKSGAPYSVGEVVGWMQMELLTRGPFVVGFEVREDFFYFNFQSEGVYACDPHRAYIGGHAVVLLGWGSSSAHWLLRNSFGPAWGDGGHFRIKRGENSCSIEQWMAVPEVAAVVAKCAEVPWIGAHGPSDLFRCRGTPVGSTCTATCGEGYRLHPPGPLRCEASGQWAPATCLPEPCQGAALSTGGPAEACNGTLVGRACPVHCPTGQDATGDGLCFAGRWRATPSCEPRGCYAPPAIAHAGHLDGCAGRPAGGTCQVHCEAGYSRTNETVICEAGRFTQAECAPLGCPYAPVIAHCVGCEYGEGARPGTELKIQCEPGFTKSGNPVCELGHWSTARCLPETCHEPPLVPNAADLLHCEGTPDGGDCWLECAEGFYRNGVLACFQGEWTQPACQPEPVSSTCTSVPQVEGSEDLWRCRNTPSGQECRLVCEEGRQAHGKLACVAGTWTRPRCEWLPCDSAPAVEHASRMESCVGAEHGSRCLLTCDPGFTPTAPFVTCSRGTWSTAERCKPSRCESVPMVANAGSDLTSCRNATAGTACPFECLQGHEADSPLLCLDGNWNAPICSALPCKQAPDAAHTERLDACAGLASGSFCEVVCLRGYDKVSDLACVRGEWEPKAEVCELSRCIQPPLVANAVSMAVCQGMTSGGTCALTCLPGYQRSGAVPVCRLGDWSLANVACAPMPCPELPSPELVPNAALELMQDCAGAVSGQPCTLACRSGYLPSGDLMCFLGKWLWEAAQCVSNASMGPTGAGARRLQAAAAPAPARAPEAVQLRASLLRRSCTTAPRVPNSKDLIACKGRHSGEICPVECEAGYQKTGDLWCIDGVWAPPTPFVRCDPMPCRVVDLFLEHAQVPQDGSCDRLPDGTSCLFQCRPGYFCHNVRPPATLGTNFSMQAGTCAAACSRGAWVLAGAVCSPRRCEAKPVIEHAVPESLTNCAGTPSGSTCPLSCWRGWHPSGKLSCERGAWTVTTCEPDACDTLQIAGKNGTGTPPSACQTQVGADKLHCQRGAWLGQAQLADGCARCKVPPVVPNSKAIMQGCTDVPSGGACRLLCADGYVPSAADVFCHDGAWQGVSCSPRPCTEFPHIQNSVGDARTRCEKIPSGGSCELHCQAGYVATGDLHCVLGKVQPVRCQPNGYLGTLDIDLSDDVRTEPLAPAAARPWGAGEWRLADVWDAAANSSAAGAAAAAAGPARALLAEGGPQGNATVRFDLPGLYVGPVGGTVAFSWRLGSELGDATLRFLVDGTEVKASGFPASGTSPKDMSWRRASFPLLPGLHDCTWSLVTTPADDAGENVAWVGDISVDNAVVLGVYHMPWKDLVVVQTGTSAEWREVVAVLPAGDVGLALQSGFEGASEPEDGAVLEATLPSIEIAPPHGSVSFYWSVSSEQGFDQLDFLVDNVAQGAQGFPQSGLQEHWQLATFRLLPGLRTLTWRYTKDSRGRAGEDVARIAAVKIRNAKVPKVTLRQALSVTRVTDDFTSAGRVVGNVASSIFGRPASDVDVSINQVASPTATAPLTATALHRPEPELSRALQGDAAAPGRQPSVYSFYNVRLGISCTSSAACGNVSATMQRIQEQLDILVQPLQAAVKQPRMLILSSAIERHVEGDVAPGLFSDEHKRPRESLARQGGGTILWWMLATLGGVVACVLGGCACWTRCCTEGHCVPGLGKDDGPWTWTQLPAESDSEE